MRHRALSMGLGKTLVLALALVGHVLWLDAAFSKAPVQASEKDGRLDDRMRMVRTQLKGFGRTTINDKAVLKAMETVPRHLFVPPSMRKYAYDDTPLPIGHGQTISQPYIVALMTQALRLKPGMKVLEIGTGSGYQAAVLAEITPEVYTIEIIKPLYESARDRLRSLSYDTIGVAQGDGYFGLKAFAPFDGIIVTCAALHVPPPLFDQLKPGGRMIIPVGGRYEVQRLLVVSKDDSGARSSVSLGPVRFVPLTRGSRNDR